MNNNQATDYSSDSELVFSNSKISDVPETNLNTVTHQAKKDEEDSTLKQIEEFEEFEGEFDLDDESHNLKAHSTPKELIKWAAKLELESLSLKELIKGDLRYILKQNYQFLSSSYSELNQKIGIIEKKLADVVNIQSSILKQKNSKKTTNRELTEGGIASKILDTLVTSKVFSTAELEQRINQVETKVDTLNGQVDSYHIQQIELLQSTVKLNEMTKERPKPSQKEKLENEDFKIQLQGINDIKEYLKLLLPKIVGMERSYQELSKDYNFVISVMKDCKLAQNPDYTDLDSNTIYASLVRRNQPKKRKLR